MDRTNKVGTALTRRRLLITAALTVTYARQREGVIIHSHASEGSWEVLRAPLAVDLSVKNTLGGSVDQITNRMKALAYVVANPANEHLSDTFFAVSSGLANVNLRSLLPGIRSQLQNSPDVIAFKRNLLDKTSFGIPALVDTPSAVALDFIGAAVKPLSLPSRGSGMPRDVDNTAATMFAFLQTSAGSHAFLALREDPRISILARIPTKSDFDTFVGALPEHSKKLYLELQRIDFSQLSTITSLISESTSNVLSDASKMYRSVIDDLNNTQLFSSVPAGQSPVSNEFHKLASTNSDLSGVTALGTFVLSNIVNDPKAAQQFATSMHIASVALGLGVALSTGGIGCVAVAQGLTSGLGELGSAGNHDEAAVAALTKVSAQIESLRAEINQRFDHLEQLQQNTLYLLGSLSKTLNLSMSEINASLNDINSKVESIAHYIIRSDREVALHEFNAKINKSKAMISAVNDGKATGYTDAYITDHLLYFLDYAIDTSGRTMFTSRDENNLAKGIRECGRADLAVGLLQNSSAILGLDIDAKDMRNPIEWARGTQAYLETHCALSGYHSDVVDANARKALAAGMTVRECISRICSPRNFRLAAKSYGDAANDFADYCGEQLERVSGNRLKGWEVGVVPLPVVPPPFPIEEWVNRGGIGKGYVYQTNANPYLWQVISVEADPIWRAISVGAVNSSPVPGGTGTVTLAPPRGVGSELGHYRDIDYFDAQNKPLARVRYIDVLYAFDRTNPVSFSLIDITINGKFDIDHANKIWMEFRNAANRAESIRVFLKDIQDTSSPIVNRFNEVGAAFALILAMAGWVVTNQLDDPWNGSVSSQMMRSSEDVLDVLGKLTIGISKEYAKYMLPLFYPRYMIDDWVEPEVIVDSWRERRVAELKSEKDQRYELMVQAFRERQDRQVVPWSDLHVACWYDVLMRTVIKNKINNTLEQAHIIYWSLKDKYKDIPLLDRRLQSLNAFLS